MWSGLSLVFPLPVLLRTCRYMSKDEVDTIGRGSSGDKIQQGQMAMNLAQNMLIWVIQQKIAVRWIHTGG